MSDVFHIRESTESTGVLHVKRGRSSPQRSPWQKSQPLPSLHLIRVQYIHGPASTWQRALMGSKSGTMQRPTSEIQNAMTANTSSDEVDPRIQTTCFLSGQGAHCALLEEVKCQTSSFKQVYCQAANTYIHTGRLTLPAIVTNHGRARLPCTNYM